MCPSALWMGRYADSHEAAAPAMKATERRLTISYPELKTRDGAVKVSAKVLVELQEEASEAIFTLEINNRSAERLQEIRFPWIGAGLGVEGKTDRFLLGCGEWPGLYPDKAEEFAFNLWDHHRRQCTVTNNMPFLDISAKGRGLSYISYHKAPVVQQIVCENLEQEPGGASLSFSWVHFPFTRPGHTWRSPRVGIGVHRGDWHATADRYRAWADTWWNAPAMPKRLKTQMGFQNIQLHRADGLALHRYEDIPKLAEAGLKYGVEDLCLWTTSHFGLYMRPPAWEGIELLEEGDPAFRQEDLRAALAEAKRRGVNVSALVNFRLIARESSLYRKTGEKNVMRTYFGAPVLDEYSDCTPTHASPRTPYLARHSVILCQKTEWFKKRSRAMVRKLLDLGYTSTFIDQAGDNHTLCLAEGHGHNSPDDVSGYEASAEAVDLFKKNDPEAYVIGENLNVFFSQIIDVSWSWSWNHSYSRPDVMRYVLPECLLCFVVDHQPAVLNKYFALGFLMAFTSGKLEKTLDDYPDFGRRVSQLKALRVQCADYIAEGRFRDKLGLEVKNTLAYVYESPKGAGIIMADTQNKAQKVRVVLNPTLLGHGKARQATLYRQDGSSTLAGKTLPDGRLCLEFNLPALEVAIWVIECPRAAKHTKPLVFGK